MKKYQTILNAILNDERKALVVSDEGMDCEIVMNAPADMEEINLMQSEIPTDYIDFLRCYNGGELYNYNDLGGFEFYDLHKLIKETAFQKENMDEDWDSSILIFCYCIGEGNYLGFKLGKDGYKIVDCFIEFLPKDWEIIGDNFDDFLCKLLEEKGRKFWLDSSFHFE